MNTVNEIRIPNELKDYTEWFLVEIPFKILQNYNIVKEIEIWIKENCMCGSNRWYDLTAQRCYFFENEVDATAFKLRWA